MSYIGTKKIKSVYIGTQKVKSVYVGTQKVYSDTPVFDGLCFTALQSGSKITTYKDGNPNISGLQKSFDGETWTSWNGTAITLANVGDKVYIRNTNTQLNTQNNYLLFNSSTGLISASGNIMSLLNYGSLYPYCFANLFKFCAALTTMPDLPAKTLAERCYYQMFYNCTSLTAVKNLPAKTLPNYCYYEMFRGCTSLTSTCLLPATTLGISCYVSMFEYCSSLTEIKTMATPTTIGNYAYARMFNYCSSLKVNNDGSSGTLFLTTPNINANYGSPFNNTGGTYTGDIVKNSSYYYYQ